MPPANASVGTQGGRHSACIGDRIAPRLRAGRMIEEHAVTAPDPHASHASRLRDVVTLVLALLLTGCGSRAYAPGALAATAPIPEGAARTRGCLDLGATTEPLDPDVLVVFVFGNRCSHPVPLDLSRARVVAHTDDPSEPAEGTPLAAKDPRGEIGPRHLDAEEWGSEKIRYASPPRGLRRVCVTFEAESAAPICNQVDRPAAEIRDWGWLDARHRGTEDFRSKRCARGGYAHESHVVGDATCTRFGEFWAYENRRRLAIHATARVTALPTFPSLSSGTGHGAHANGDAAWVGEIGWGLRQFVVPSFYVGGSLFVGGGPAPSRLLVVPNDANGSTVAVLTLGGELVAGTRVALTTRIQLDGEAALQGRAVDLVGPTNLDDPKRARFDVAYGVFAVVPRVALEVFVTHDTSLRAFGGADAVHGLAPAFGLDLTLHLRSYGGPPLP